MIFQPTRPVMCCLMKQLRCFYDVAEKKKNNNRLTIATFATVGRTELCYCSFIFIVIVTAVSQWFSYRISLVLIFKYLFQNENRALRLKEGVTAAQLLGSDVAMSVQRRVPSSESSPDGTPDQRLAWNYFDEVGYVRRGGLKLGEDPYVRNRFNQEASDAIPSNRDIPDTRNVM